jgi:hypothetical protein
MSNLRQKKRETVDPDEDIEALISPDDDGAPGPATSSKPATAGRLQHNPFFVARLVLRKVGELITSDDDNEENITSSVGIIAFLRDLVIGIVFGLLTVSFLIFLDHKDVIHLKSAHGYRDMGLQMMRDPETRKNVEENSGLKFMEADEYQRKIPGSTSQIWRWRRRNTRRSNLGTIFSRWIRCWGWTSSVGSANGMGGPTAMPVWII